jgi:hypothetical protein
MKFVIVLFSSVITASLLSAFIYFFVNEFIPGTDPVKASLIGFALISCILFPFFWKDLQNCKLLFIKNGETILDIEI